MNTEYADIRSRIQEEPSWFDEYAVPRYGAFSPRMVASIYAKEVALAEVACQACRRLFRVAFSHINGTPGTTIAEAIQARTLDYGDPPNVRCCAAGPSMTSVGRRVLEYWTRKDRRDWKRDSRLEVDITPDWARD